MKKLLLFLSVMIISQLQLLAQPYIIVNPTSVVPMTSTNIGRFEKFELGIQLSREFDNPFDPDEIEVYAIFTNLNSGTEERINGFWYQDFDMNEVSHDPTRCTNNPSCCYDARGVGDPNFLTPVQTNLNWRIRFSPDETGTWEYVVYVNNVGHITNSNPYTFDCIESDNKGNLSVGNNKTHFVYKNSKNKDGEESFVPLGINTRDNLSISSVFNRGEYNYVKKAIEKISSVGGNTIRLFMTFDEFGIEWKEDGLGNYTTRQYQAYALDKIFELAEKKNVKIQLVLLSNHEFESKFINDWANNPYKPLLSNPESQYDFFTNPTCINYIKKRFHYIVSRWGYSTSILAYEFWNEVALIHNPDPTKPNIWTNGNGQIVDDWHTEMVKYIKEMDSRHMFTTSAGGPGFTNFGITSMDFTQEHYYSRNKNMAYNTSVSAQHAISSFNKPFIMGETGFNPCTAYTIAYTRPEFTSGIGVQPHEDLFFHNGLWSSLFNGSAGSDLYWGGFFLIDDCKGGSYRMFEPASIFLKDEDFFTKDLRFITNNPTGLSGEKDHPAYNYDNNSLPVSEFYPSGNYPANPLAEFTHHDIETSNDDLIDVFAAKTTDWNSKIYGWVHNNENYWYKTRHGSGGVECTGDESDNQVWSGNDNTTSPDLVPTLTRQTMTFKGLDCDGAYRVEYYSTWPQYDINNDGNLDQGGVVAAFTQSWVYAHCGMLEVIIPTLTPLASLSTAPFAPDYAFKITKYQDSWSHHLVSGGLNTLSRVSVYNSDKLFYSDYNGAIRTTRFDNNTNTFQHTLISPSNPNQNEKANGVICANGANQVFYKGYDGRLQCYYLTNNGTYDHVWLTDWSNTSQNVGNYISVGPNTIYYQGSDAKIHRYFFNTVTGWEHSTLPFSGNTNELVVGAIAMNTTATQVYYKGFDGKLQCYYKDNNNNWVHTWIAPNWNITTENVGGDIKCVPEGIFYAGADGKLQKCYFDSNQGIWIHTYVLNQYNQQIDIPANTQISFIGNADQIYFKGLNGHTQQLYSKQGNKYTQDEIICEADLEDGFKNNGNIAAVDDGAIYYIGSDNNLHMYAWDAGCNPRSDKKGRKPGKTDAIKDVTFKDLSDKFQWKSNVDLISEPRPISISPNPFTNKIMINTNNLSLLVSVNIVDVFGRKVFASTELSDKFEINTDPLSPGVYIVTLYHNGSIIRKEKIVKK